MKLLSRWFRRPPMAPSWIEPTALATWLERDDAPLIVDVRGPDEFGGPLGHIREATNILLVELPAHFPIWFVRAGLSSWSAKQTVDHPWRRTSCRRPVCLMCRYCVADGTVASARLAGELRSARRDVTRTRAALARRGNRLGYATAQSLDREDVPYRGTCAHRGNPLPRTHPWQ